MAQLGSKKRPAIIRVRTEEMAQAMLAKATGAGVEIICGIEPDKPEDITDLTRAIKMRRSFTRSEKPAKNAPCPCGSGRNYKGCCGKKTR